MESVEPYEVRYEDLDPETRIHVDEAEVAMASFMAGEGPRLVTLDELVPADEQEPKPVRPKGVGGN